MSLVQITTSRYYCTVGFLLFFFLSNQSTAQDLPHKMNVDKRFNVAYIDSIIREHLAYLNKLNQTSNQGLDTARLNTMIYLSYLYFQVPHERRDSALIWADQVLIKANQSKNNYYKAEAIIKKAEFLDRFKSNYQDATQLLNEVLRIPGLLPQQQFFVRRMIATIYAKTDNNYATPYIENLIEDIRHSSMADKTKAQDLYNLYIAIAETNSRKKNEKVSLNAYLNALVEVKKFNQGIGLAYLNASIAEKYIYFEDYENVTKYLEDARFIFEKFKIPYNETLNFINVRMHLKKKEYAEASRIGEEILKNITDRKFKRFSNTHKESHKVLYDAYKGLGVPEKSLFHLENYMSVKDSLESQKYVKEIDELIKKYDFEQLKSANEKELLEKNNALQFFKLREFQKTAENQSLKEILLSEKLENVEMANLNRTKILNALAQKRGYESDLEKMKVQRLEEKLNFRDQNRSLWFIFFLVTTVLIVTGVILFLVQFRQKYQFNQQQAEYQKHIFQAEITALRAQMNPHFIFNCLNSIQLFTAQNDIEKASEYLAKFSKLIRLVLENSRSEKVTLENELETLRLYMELEAMRFRGRFRHEITVDKDLDQDQIEIPPLILQPFVENAIWHGLMHKETGGVVQVNIEPKYATTHTAEPERISALVVSITDDGVGRQKAAEFKSKSATKNKSFGMKVTAERIELINQLYNTKTQVSIIDLKDENGEAAGTKVIIEIPV